MSVKETPTKPSLSFGKYLGLHLLGNEKGACNCFHFWRGGEWLLHTFVNWIGTDEQPRLLFLYLSGNLANYSSHFLQKIKTMSFSIFHVLGNIIHSVSLHRVKKWRVRNVCLVRFKYKKVIIRWVLVFIWFIKRSLEKNDCFYIIIGEEEIWFSLSCNIHSTQHLSCSTVNQKLSSIR